MIHRDNILNSPTDTKDRIATNIKRFLARYPQEILIYSGPLHAQLVNTNYIHANDRLRRRQLEIILVIIQGA